MLRVLCLLCHIAFIGGLRVNSPKMGNLTETVNLWDVVSLVLPDQADGPSHTVVEHIRRSLEKIWNIGSGRPQLFYTTGMCQTCMPSNCNPESPRYGACSKCNVCGGTEPNGLVRPDKCNIQCGASEGFFGQKFSEPLEWNKCAHCKLVPKDYMLSYCTPRTKTGTQQKDMFVTDAHGQKHCCELATCHEPDIVQHDYDCRNSFTGGLRYVGSPGNESLVLDLASGLKECPSSLEEIHRAKRMNPVCCPDFTPRQGSCAISLDACLETGVEKTKPTRSIGDDELIAINKHRSELGLPAMKV